jgi:hypothetical protein
MKKLIVTGTLMLLLLGFSGQSMAGINIRYKHSPTTGFCISSTS